MLKNILLLLLLLKLTVSIVNAQQSAITGTWNGALQVSGIKLRLVFHITTKPDGTLSATMDSPDQGAKGIPVQSVRFAKDSLHLNIPAISGQYAGKLLSEGKIDGALKQGGQSMSIPLSKGEIEAPKRPQEPVKPYPYKEQEVSIANKAAGITLAGTLTVPAGNGPHTAVILFTGSGPQDRDESILGHKPFLVLADHLTRQGFAVLRLDDRGVGESTGNFQVATTQDFATDGVAAFEFLKEQSGIDKKKIGFLGHSEGALVAIKAAEQSPDVAFVVLMAGSGVVGWELLAAQNEAILKHGGATEEVIKPYINLRREQFKAAATETDAFKAAEKIKKLQQDAISQFTEKQRAELGLTAQGEQAIIAQLSTPWSKYFLAYDPAPALHKLKMPVLALNGSKDLQVPSKQNLSAIENALKSGKNKNYTIQELPGLNHLFQTAKAGSISEYGQLEETIAPIALETISNWLKSAIK